MKKALKLILYFLFGLMALAIVLWFSARNVIAEKVVHQVITSNCDCGSRVTGLNLSATADQLKIDSISLLHPVTSNAVLTLEALDVQVDPWSLLKPTKVIPSLSLSLPELVLHRDAKGATTLDCLGETVTRLLPPPVFSPGVGGLKSPGILPPAPSLTKPPKRSDGKAGMAVQIQDLELKLGAIDFRDEATGVSIPTKARAVLDDTFRYTDQTNLASLRDALRADLESKFQGVLQMSGALQSRSL